MKNPSVVIVLAVFEPDPHYFAEQLRSIRGQTFTDWICLLGCDAPIQDHEMVKEFRRDQRFVWMEHPRRLGFKRNFETLIHYASALYPQAAVALCDQDDMWYPQKLEQSMRQLSASSAALVVHDLQLFQEGVIQPHTYWERMKRTAVRDSVKGILAGSVFPGCSMLLSAELAARYPRQTGGIRYHDHLIALMAIAAGGLSFIDATLSRYRIHSSNVSIRPDGSAAENDGVFAKARNRYAEAARMVTAVRESGGSVSEDIRDCFGGDGAALRCCGKALSVLFQDRTVAGLWLLFAFAAVFNSDDRS